MNREQMILITQRTGEPHGMITHELIMVIVTDAKWHALGRDLCARGEREPELDAIEAGLSEKP
jgi:hypothetical protein